MAHQTPRRVRLREHLEYLETDTCDTNLHVEYLQMEDCTFGQHVVNFRRDVLAGCYALRV